MSTTQGSAGRLAVLQILARHPDGLHEAELLIGMQVQLREAVAAADLRELLRALQQPMGTPKEPRPALVAREARLGRWYSPQARDAADARAGRPVGPHPAAMRGARHT